MKTEKYNLIKKIVVLFLLSTCICVQGFAQHNTEEASDDSSEISLNDLIVARNDSIIALALLRCGSDAQDAKNGDKGAILRQAEGYKAIVEKSPEAIVWYREAAENGEVKFQKEMGYLYMQGGAVGQDYKNAIGWFDKAAAQGDAEAMVTIGYIHLNGFGDVTKDSAAAEKWFDMARKSADNNPYFNVDGRIDLITKYSVEHSDSDFADLQLKAESDAKTAIALGDMYAEHGDREQARYWYDKAIAKGGLQAELAQQHRNRQSSIYNPNPMHSSTALVVPQEYQRSGEVTTRVPKNSVEAQKAFDNASKLLTRAAQTPPTTATQWQYRAKAGDADAMYRMGLIYKVGYEEVRKDKKEAFEWFQRSAQAGNIDAMKELGHAYADGDGCKKDLDEAIKWFTKAADTGDSNAMHAMGYYYLWKIKDYPKAKEWLTLAALKGEITAVALLADMYYYGNGFYKDRQKADQLYQYAADKGDKYAQSRIKTIAEGRALDQAFLGALQSAITTTVNTAIDYSVYALLGVAPPERTPSSSSQISGGTVYRVRLSSAYIAYMKNAASALGGSWKEPDYTDFDTEQKANNYLREHATGSNAESIGRAGELSWFGTVEKIGR